MKPQDYPLTSHVNALEAACDIQNVLASKDVQLGGMAQFHLEHALRQLNNLIKHLECRRHGGIDPKCRADKATQLELFG